jgi:hypothetical protein
MHLLHKMLVTVTSSFLVCAYDRVDETISTRGVDLFVDLFESTYATEIVEVAKIMQL